MKNSPAAHKKRNGLNALPSIQTLRLLLPFERIEGIYIVSQFYTSAQDDFPV